MNLPVDAGLDAIRPFLGQLLGGPFAQIGGIFEDRLREWRFYNQLEILKRVQKKAEERNLDLDQLSGSVLPETLIPLLDAGANAKDQMLSELFANLLLASIDPATAESIHPSYSQVLAQITPLEARILDILHEHVEAEMPNDSQKCRFMDCGLGVEGVAKRLRTSLKQLELALMNLERLGVLSNLHIDQRPDLDIRFSTYGHIFMMACLATPDEAEPKSLAPVIA